MIPPSVLLENSLNIFYIKCSEDHKIEYSNEIFTSYASHISPELLKHVITDEEDYHRAQKAMTRAVETSPFPTSFQGRVPQKNGAKRWCTWEVAYGNKQYHLFGIQLFDVVSISSHQYERQQRLLEKIGWIQSHKVRKPLANIIGLVDLIEKSKKHDQEDASVIKMLSQSAQELDDIIREITDLCSEA